MIRTMSKSRLEAFSDGVIAIIITIMVLELKPPHGTAWADLAQVLPGWLRYALSFVYVGIYWVNHHALFERVAKVDGAALWANLHLLFWMSLIPYVTAWAGENPMAPVPVALYGAVLLLCSVSFMLLSWRLDVERQSGRVHSWGSRKNRLSILLYTLAIVLSLWHARSARRSMCCWRCCGSCRRPARFAASARIETGMLGSRQAGQFSQRAP